jgi:1-acyl-sn-glycerol-3-phosphate acyltransferase
MHNIVVDKPYRFVAPARGDLLPRALGFLLPHCLRRSHSVDALELRGLDLLKESLAAGHGIALTPNHCRAADPLVLASLARAAGMPFYYMASWHQFMQGGSLRAWVINRLGAFSVYREGMDRDAIAASVKILAESARPLVLFPEGLISRTNDALRPFLEGISLITHAAAKERAAAHRSGMVVVHPVAIKYFLTSDPAPALGRALDEIETRLSWRPSAALPAERIAKVGAALLALKEIEYLGAAQSGDVAARLENLIDFLLQRLESKWVAGKRQATLIGRVKALRAAILKEMIHGELSPAEKAARWKDLTDIALAVQLSLYPPHYVRSKPTPERLTETVEGFEEDLTDKARVLGRWRAVVEVGEAMKIEPERERGQNCLTGRLHDVVEHMRNGLDREREAAR